MARESKAWLSGLVPVAGLLPALFLGLITGLAAALAPGAARAGEATVAVAANFITTLRALEPVFEAETGHNLRISVGSTGALYAQIVRGAPFDVFLSADVERPVLLEQEGRTLARQAYALGQLALVGKPETFADGSCPSACLAEARAVAIADPEVAPYGVAAMEAIAGWGLMPDAVRIVRGGSVGQAASLVSSGNAPLGILAAAQAVPLRDAGLTVVPVPPELHAPIRQDAVLLLRGAENPAAQSFFEWLGSDTAQEIVEAAGYGALR